MSSHEEPATIVATSPSKKASKKEPRTKKDRTPKGKREKAKKRKQDPSESDSLQELFDEILVEYIEQGNEVPEKNNEKYQKFQKDVDWKLDRLPHHFLPQFNMNTKNSNIKDVRSDLLLEVSLPHSVYVSSKCHTNIDICHRRTMALDNYIQRLKNMQKIYLTSLKKNKKARKDEKDGVYSGAIIEYARRKDANPDKYFFGDYDFYYTSGNLCAHPETNLVLHVNGSNMEKLSISMFTVEDNIPELKPITSIDLTDEIPKNSEIFETQFSNGDCDTFFARRRLCISMHQYMNSKLRTVQKFRSKEVPFISFAQDKCNPNHLAISNLNHQVRLYDIEQGTALQALKLVTEDETKPFTNWNIIRSWDTSVYLYASNRKLNVIDIRTPESEWRNNYCGYEKYYSCSNFCNLTLSNFENMFYVGSSHKLYMVDMRQLSKNIEDKNTSVVRWTHQMSCWPLMMATSRNIDYEYVTLQSPASSDLRICESIKYLAESNDNTEDTKDEVDLTSQLNYQYKSPCMPYMPPSLEKVFHAARRNGKGIKPSSGMDNRIRACNTGLSFVGDNTNPYILTATSHGDVFAMHMIDRDNKSHRHTAVEVIGRFEENIFHSVRKVPLQVTQVCDLSAINKVFRCSKLNDFQLGEDEVAVPKRKYMGRWQKSLRTLCSYKDALVNDLLSIWDVEDEDDKGVNIKALGKSEEMESNSIVSSWLNSAQNFSHSTSLNGVSYILDGMNDSNFELESTLNDLLTNTTSLVNNDSVFNNISAISNNATQEAEDTTICTQNRSKASKKKSRYIKGF